MSASTDRLEALKLYCRIDGDVDDSLVEMLYDAAVGYMTGAGVSEPENGTKRRAQYDLCVNAMVLDAYDRRSSTVSGAVINDNPAFRRMLNQLKLTEAAPAASGAEE